MKLADEGCNLVICDINEVEIINTRNEVKSKTGKKVIAVKVDITDEKDVKDMVDIAV